MDDDHGVMVTLENYSLESEFEVRVTLIMSFSV